MADINTTSIGNEWNENREYLNLPGLEYLWYTKIKPAIDRNNIETKGRIDDEGWYATYNENTGEVYMTVNDDTSTFYFDQDGICGGIQENNGMFQVVTDRNVSRMVDGFIDDSVGIIGDSSMTGDATGNLYVNFDRDDTEN